MILLGIDPGFANVGVAVLKIGKLADARRRLGGGFEFEVLSTDVLRTSKSDKNVKIYVADDNIRRLREMLSSVCSVIDEHEPIAICAEAMSFPRNASSAAKMALFWGGLVAVAHERDIPLYSATPQQIKIALCGNKAATKDDIAAAVTKHAAKPVPMKLARTKQEHAYDAIGAALTCLGSDELRLARKLSA